MSRHVPSQSRYTQQQQQQQGSSNSRIAGGSSSSRASGLPQPQQSSAGHRARFADTTVQDGGDDDDDGEEEDNIETTTTTTTRSVANRGVRLTALQQLVKDKHAEWEGFVDMYKHTEQLDAFLKQTADRTDLLRDGGATMAEVTRNWQNVFRATHIAIAGLAARQAAGETQDRVPQLVRIPIGGRPNSDSQDDDAQGA